MTAYPATQMVALTGVVRDAGAVRVVTEPTAKVGLRTFATATPAGLASYLDAATLTSVAISLAIWREHFGLGVWQVGVLGAGLTLFVAVGALIGGGLGDLLGWVRVLNTTLVVFVAGTLVIITADNGTVLTLGVVLVGLAAGADIPTSLAVIVELAPAGARGRLVAFTQVLWIAGILATFGWASRWPVSATWGPRSSWPTSCWSRR